MHQKSSAIVALRHFLAMIENQFGIIPKEWMSDAGGEYKSDEFIRTLKVKGIKILQSTPHTLQQNGCAERLNRTIMDKSEAMRHEACLPDSWWEFAIEHTVYCYNRTPIKHIKWRTPFEVIHRQKPDISKLRVFGCGAYVYLPPSVRKNKLSPKSELMVHIGIVDGIKGYRFMRPKGFIFTAPSALFDEEMYPRCKTQMR
jgi:transposase InsO family protein